MALGAASELIQLVHSSSKSHGFESRQQQSELMTMASVCFDEAMKLLNVAYMEISTISTQCVFLAASVVPFFSMFGTWLTSAQYLLLLSSTPVADMGAPELSGYQVPLSTSLRDRIREF